MPDAAMLTYASGADPVKDEIQPEKPIAEKQVKFKKLGDSIEWKLKKY